MASGGDIISLELFCVPGEIQDPLTGLGAGFGSALADI